MNEKKTAVITVRLPDAQDRFIELRSKQMSMESPGEYIRHLVSQDMQKASNDLKLLQVALGVTVFSENKDYKE